MEQRVILNERHLELTINRLCYQLIENHNDFAETVLVALQPRGAALGKAIHSKLRDYIGDPSLKLGLLDVSFYRDDFRRRENPIQVSRTEIDFLVENKRVILIDDVLFTGRTVRSGLDALLDFGRPHSVEFLVLIDRRFSRQLPIQADYIGRTVDSVASERVDVQWEGESGRVVLNTIQVHG